MGVKSWAFGALCGVATAFLFQAIVGVAPAMRWVRDIPDLLTADGRMFAQARKAASASLLDPYTAHFEGLRIVQSGVGPAVCGYVNAKNRMGAYTGNKAFIYYDTSKLALTSDDASKDPFIEKQLATCEPGAPLSPAERLIIERLSKPKAP